MVITKNFRRNFFALLFGLAIHSSVANAAILSLQPYTTFSSNGEAVALDLVVSGLGDFGPDSLGVFDIDIGFDPLALSFTHYSLGSLLGDLGLFEALDISTGDGGTSVNLAEVSLLSAGALYALQPSDFVLASLSFNVLDLAEGVGTQVSIGRDATLGDSSGDRIDVSDAQSATVEGRASVPLPGTFFLCLLPLFGLPLTRRNPTDNR